LSQSSQAAKKHKMFLLLSYWGTCTLRIMVRGIRLETLAMTNTLQRPYF